jgi:hypothetical protein
MLAFGGLPMTLETDQIKEVAPGAYWVLLECPQSSLLRDLLDPGAGYVLCWGHYVGAPTWSQARLPVLDLREPIPVLSRIAHFDFILPTAEFLGILPRLSPGIKAVQLRKLPPDYLDMRRVKGKQLYRILGECGWHVLLDTPGNDYGELMSPRREVLERAVEIMRTSE